MDLADFRIIGKVEEVRSIAINRKIREVQRLRKLYGSGRWRKMKGVASVEFANGLRFRAELHWYEAHGIGKRKMKIKALLDQLP